MSESREHGGTSLGLALVEHILNWHGGRLTIESLAGTAHFPLALPEEAGFSLPPQ
jgi:two-component system phosphate regulon sensor histidine kinase PhoR